MGVDNPDVEFIVHYEIPKEVESYNDKHNDALLYYRPFYQQYLFVHCKHLPNLSLLPTVLE